MGVLVLVLVLLGSSIVYTDCLDHNVEAGSSGRIVVGRSGIALHCRRGGWGGMASIRCRSRVGGHDCDGGG